MKKNHSYYFWNEAQTDILLTNAIHIEVQEHLYFAMMNTDNCRPVYITSKINMVDKEQTEISLCAKMHIPDHVHSDNYSLSTIRKNVKIQPLKTHYYTFAWVFSPLKYLLEFIFNPTCDMKNNHVSMNISNIVGFGNIIRWERLKDQYMNAYCHNPSEYMEAPVYTAYINVGRKSRTIKDPRNKPCQMTVTKLPVTSNRAKGQSEEIEFVRHFSNGFPTHGNVTSLFHGIPTAQTHVSNFSWNRAAELCENFNSRELFKVGLFTYLTELELQGVTDKLERQGILDGSPLIIFTGFIGDSVSHNYSPNCTPLMCWQYLVINLLYSSAK